MLEIVITGRNDDFGGADFVDRLCAAASRNHMRLDAAGVAHTFTLAEWNPPPGRPLLAEIVTSRLPFWSRAVVADPEWHRRLSQNPRLQFMEFFAKNAAIRRSRADAILTTNSDVFLSEALVARLAGISWRDETVYRATRYDIDRTIDWREVPESVFADPSRHVRVNHLAGPEFGTAAGDFLLLSRATFHRFRGFNETVRYAKVHKDGQFCFRAWLEGLAIEALGPIWHIDHDGSYANAGASFGSPDAPYGPEWNYRVDYRNPASWGLASAVEEPLDARITWLRHPSSSGPSLSVVGPAPTGDSPGVHAAPRPDCERIPVAGPWTDIAAVNEAIASARGQFIFVTAAGDTFPQSFPQGDSPNVPPLPVTDELDALLALVRERRPDLVAVGGACTTTAHEQIVPLPGAPFGFSRDVYEAIGDWRQASADPALDFWARAVRGRTVAVWHPVGEPGWRPAGPVRAALPAALAEPLDAGAAGRELAGAIADAPIWVARWIAGLGLEPGSPVAVLGPDWATAFLMAGARATRLRVVALVSTDPRERGTHQHGHRVRGVDALVESGAVALLGASVPAALPERLRAAGYTGRVATWFSEEPESLPLEAPSELKARRAMQAEALASADLDEVLAGLPILCALEGDRQFTHRYDAASLAERCGRPEEARRLFASAAGPRNGDDALRMRAVFHEGRLLLTAGQAAAALACFDRVLAHTPGHARALGLAVEAYHLAPDATISNALRARLEQDAGARGDS